jgi:type IV pilus assembly protein PilX
MFTECQWTMHVLLNSNLSNASDTVTAIDSSSWTAPYAAMMTPRSVDEVFPDGASGVDLTAQTGDQSYLYRITGRGFGLNQQINVTLESIFRPYG